MSGLLEGKTALLTQADEYMGPPIAEKFEEEGAAVIRDNRDLSQAGAVEDLLNDMARLDILVANLAESEAHFDLVQHIKDDDWRHYFDFLATPLMKLVRGVAPAMIDRGGGKIVAITSAAPLRGIPKGSAYCAARGAQNAFIRAAGIELARNNIQLNAIAQNYVENVTYYPDTMLADEDLMARMLKIIPAKRLGKGEETADLAAFLASDRSNFIVGQVIPFAGGWVTTTG